MGKKLENLEKLEKLYEGKAKTIYSTANNDLIIMYYKNDATAFNGEKKSLIENKGKLNNQITAIIYKYLESNGINTHLKEKISDKEQLCKKVSIIPLEVIVRNKIAGSLAKRLNVKEGKEISNIIYELSYKDDSLGDPLINDHHAVAINAVSYDDLKIIYEMTARINEILSDLFKKASIELVDFKIEFGKTNDGQIVLADEISPDTCRLWDLNTGKKLDKDRFRRDLGSVQEAYLEVLKRLEV